MGFVADAVGDAVGWVGDAISDVADFVVDDILEPIIDTVGGVIQGMADDPLGTIITIGAAATGNPWVIAAAAAANSARNGGDIGDMLLSAAASYAGSYVGDIAAEAVGGYVGEAAGETLGNIAGKAASGATRAAVSATLTGGDIGAALLNGALSGAAGAGLSELGDYVKSEFSNSLDVDELSTDIAGQIDYEGFDDTFVSTKDSIFNELSDLVEGFQELPQTVQDMVTGGASAAITSLVTTGEINEDLVAGSIMSAAVTTGIVKEVIADSELFTADTNEARLRSAMLTNVVSDTIKAGYAGADPYQAFQASFNNQAISGLKKAIDDATEGGVDRIIDEITGAQAVVDEKYTAANQLAAEVDIARGVVQETYDEYTAAIDRYNADINVSITDQATADARLAEIDTIKAKLDGFVTDYQGIEAEYTTVIAEYKTATDGLIRAEQYIDEIMQPVNEVANKYMVETLTGYTEDPESGALVPNFKADEYRELYNLPEDVDPYKHWIATGRRNDISQETRDTKIDETIRAKLGDVILKNIDTKLNSAEDIDDLVNSVKASVGGDLTAANSNGVLSLAQEYLDGVEARTPTGDISIARDEGVTDADIASGEALAIVNRVGDEVGITFTKTPNLGWPVFDARLNRTVQPIYDASSGKAVYIDPVTKQPIEGYLAGDIQSDGTVLFGDGTISIRNLPPPAPTLTEVAKVAPVVAIDAAGNLNINQEEYDKLDWGTRQLLNFSKAVSEAANNYADSIGMDEDELSTDSNAAYRVKLAAGAALDAGGQLLNAFNGVVTFFRNDRYKPIDARETNLGKVTQAMMQIGTATQPEEYNAVIKDLRQQFEKAEGFGGTVEAIYEGFKQAPAEFLVEFVGKELAQEVPLVLASGGTGLIARGAAGAAQATKALATKLGRATAWGTNAGLQVLETAGATAAETYAELYDEMIKMGVSPEQAAVKAQEGATLNGATAAIIEGTLGRIIAPSDILAKKIAGKQDNLLGTALDNITKRGLGVAGEGVSEGLEETASQYLKIAMLEKINPAITQQGGRYADFSGSLTQAGVLGAVAGTGTAAGITVGDVVYDAVQNGTYTGGDTGIPEDFWAPQSQTERSWSANPVANSVILFNPDINEAVANSNAPDVDPDVRAQAQQTIKDTLNWGSFFDDQGQILDFSEDADGTWSYQTTTDILNAANDNAYTTYGEAQEAYQAIEDQTPYELSDAEISGFVGEVPDTDVSRRVIDTANRGYIGQIFEQEGYTPEEADYLAALEQAGEGVFGETLGTELATLYDPRAVTQEEAQQAFEELGFFDALPTDVQRLVGQYDESELAGRTQDQLPVATYNALVSRQAQQAAEQAAALEQLAAEQAAAQEQRAAEQTAFIDSVTSLIGKPAQQVTDADIDFVTDLIAQREVISEPAPLTAQQLQYDVTGDNVIDINDQIVLQNLQQSQQTGQQIGQATQINPATQFAATGITGQIADMNARLQRQQQMQNVQQFAAMLEPGGRGAVKTLDVEQDPLYFYDPITSENIFATPQQSGVFNAEDFFGLGLAAAEGGLVEDKTDEIMSILGGRRG
jgi:hypothetical protein